MGLQNYAKYAIVATDSNASDSSINTPSID